MKTNPDATSRLPPPKMYMSETQPSLVEYDNPKLVALLVNAGFDPNSSYADGYSILHKAASNHDIELVRLLLGAGANPNASTKRASTPLFFAMSNAVIAEMLIDAGADINADDGEMTLIETLEYMIRDHQKTIDRLIKKEADGNAEDGDMMLVESFKSTLPGQREVIDLLIRKGVVLPTREDDEYQDE